MKLYPLAFLAVFLFDFHFPTENNTNLVFKSTDAGKTWQNISEGLPEKWDGDVFFANENGLYVNAEDAIFHNSASTSLAWEKELFPKDHNRVSGGKSGMYAYKIYAYNWYGQFLQKMTGSNEWAPLFTNFQPNEIRTVFETSKGTLFIGTEYRLYKTTDRGQTWKQVSVGGGMMKMAESNGVMMATSGRGIERSTDEGDTWQPVLSEGGVGIDVQPINGGFAAIVYNTQVKARSVKVTFDAGKTWTAIDAGLPASFNTASIVEMDGNLFCGHPGGLFKSSDKGKTWKLVFPPVAKKVFILYVSGNTIYAVPRMAGC